MVGISSVTNEEAVTKTANFGVTKKYVFPAQTSFLLRVNLLRYDELQPVGRPDCY